MRNPFRHPRTVASLPYCDAMAQRWTTSSVDAAAPDDQVRKAGRRLATPTPWSDAGVTGTLLFGRCRGSGANPYQVSVDLDGPRYQCNCPSRKFPCKHAVALLYLYAEGHVDATGVAADFAAAWEAKHADRTVTRSAAPAPETPEQTAEREQAAAQRAAERDARVDAGLADAERFLTDLIAEGLAADSAGRPRRFTDQAARLVDAQAPGLAGRFRALAEITDATPRWTEALADGIGQAQLLIRAWQRRASLPDDLAATARNHLGFTTRAADVLALPGVTDTWVVAGLRDADEERVSVRRVWLWGRRTGRTALVLFFAAGGATLESPLFPGTTVEATLHFYPGRPALRAALGDRAEQALPVSSWRPEALTVERARLAWRDALAADPWLDAWPVVIAGRLTGDQSGHFGLTDDTGDALALWGDKCWPLIGLAAGRDCLVVGEISSEGVQPCSVLLDDQLVVL